jgi:putative ABC transport system permease protein
MHIFDILHETYSALSANKVRSGLTMLGIIIGIASVIAMLAIGQGAQSSITSSIESMGSNLLTVQPGAQRGPGTAVSSGRGSARSLKLSDAEAIKTLSLVKAVAPEVTGQYQLSAQGQNTNVRVVGTNSSYPEVKNIQTEDGNFISEMNVKSGSLVVVLGPTTRDDLFGTGASVIGQMVKIKTNNFKIIGVTKAKGGTGFMSQDDIAYIPVTTSQRYFSGNEYLSTIDVEAIDADSMAAAQDEITTLLMTLHKIKSEATADFNIMNQADILSTMSNVTQIFTILLGSVAGISLVVGGIGIMNMMLTTVTERTREIGLRKAIGAKRRDISLQFLIEAVALTFLGGVIGVILGWLVAWGIAYSGLVPAKVSLFSVLLAFSVSTIIGVAFGYYPARRAAALNPIDALRYE